MGHIDIFCSNAGIAVLGDEHESNDMWQKNWDIHVMGHVYAARAVVQHMIERGGGYLVNTAQPPGFCPTSILRPIVLPNMQGSVC